MGISRLADEIKVLAVGRNLFTRLWNSEARFVVAGTIEFAKSEQNKIFDYFSKFEIYNCIIVIQEHYLKRRL